MDPRDDLVARQYRKWRYPEPILDLDAWTASHWDRFDPSHCHRVMWPVQPYRPDMDILVAGCGTNQAPVLAYRNRDARVVALDISEESLDHGRYLKSKHGLTNLELRLLPIEEATTLDRRFDLIVSTGVLHHMASPEAGLRALADVLKPDGVVALMVYARYGRWGVEVMQSAFRAMGLAQDEHSLQVVKAALRSLPPGHPIERYLMLADDLRFDAGLVDTFLHGRDRSYTVADCLRLVDSADLVFQDWLLKANYYPFVVGEHSEAFVSAVAGLPTEQMWSVVERINTDNACHFFLATSPSRPISEYRIDFSGADALQYVPVFRFRCGIDGEDVVRPDWSVRLEPAHLNFVRAVDGEASIGEILRRVGAGGDSGGIADDDLPSQARALFEGLWRADFVAIDTSRVR